MSLRKIVCQSHLPIYTITIINIRVDNFLSRRDEISIGCNLEKIKASIISPLWPIIVQSDVESQHALHEHEK